MKTMRVRGQNCDGKRASRSGSAAWWAELELGSLAVLWLCFHQSTATEIKLGLISTIVPSVGSDPLTAFLAAVHTINADPATYLGNDSFTVVPYWMVPLSATDVYKVGGMRSVMRLGADNYTASEEPAGFSTIKPLPENATNPVVDIMIFAGNTPGSLAMAPVAEFLDKPCLGVIDTGDPLSDKVRDCKTGGSLSLSLSLTLSFMNGTCIIYPLRRSRARAYV